MFCECYNWKYFADVENIKSRLNTLNEELNDLKMRKHQQEQEMKNIENVALLHRFQVSLDNLLSEQLEKEQEVRIMVGFTDFPQRKKSVLQKKRWNWSENDQNTTFITKYNQVITSKKFLSRPGRGTCFMSRLTSRIELEET